MSCVVPISTSDPSVPPQQKLFVRSYAEPPEVPKPNRQRLLGRITIHRADFIRQIDPAQLRRGIVAEDCELPRLRSSTSLST